MISKHLAAMTAMIALSGIAHAADRKRPAPVPTATSSAKPLYWYDPMRPDRHFARPGKSPFMDMQLVPKFPDRDNRR